MQRSLSLLNEQEAFHQETRERLSKNIDQLLEEHHKLSGSDAVSLLNEIRLGLAGGLEHAEEKLALAEHIHSTIHGHVCKLEDDLKHFEEEVRLSKVAATNKTVTHYPAHTQPEPESSSHQKRSNKRNRLNEETQEEALPSTTGRKRSRANSTHQGLIEAVINEARTDVPSSPSGKHRVAAPNSPGSKSEQTYCYCGQPSYGEMIGCDANDACEIEWFHYGCVGLTTPPKDQWFCPDCTARMARQPVQDPDVNEANEESAHEEKKEDVEPSFV